jgi:hypothetical protein
VAKKEKIVKSVKFKSPRETKNYFNRKYKGAKLVGAGTWKAKNGNTVKCYLFGIVETK